MYRASIRSILNLSLFAVLLLVSASVLAGDSMHKIVMHVDENDPARMNLVLNNAANLNKYYQDKAEEAMIEIVAYGPGLHMLRADTSPVKGRIKSFEQNFDNISFRACSNTYRKMSKKAGKKIPLVPQAKMVDSGAVHLVQRQESGWAYLRP
jgi:intracellular sulfur oxidation DsrE/DsrF family protein